MSRIGKAPITVPNGVDVAIDGDTVTVKGPKGELSREIPDGITVTPEDGDAHGRPAPTTSARSVRCTG